MKAFEITIKSVYGERSVIVNAWSDKAAVAKVQKTLVGQEKRWASVFA